MNNDKVIKALNTSKYSIELVETPSHMYVVQYEAKRYGERQYSEPVNDYNTASFLFDLKIEELEGN
jgi:hypothetical protein